MKNGIIIYQSKYGAAEKYAHWLSEDTDFDCKKVSEATTKDLNNYQTVILCGGIYASGIAGLSFLRKNAAQIKNKTAVIFCVGASPYDEKALQSIKDHNLKDELKNIPVFYGRGIWDEEKMHFVDRTLCGILKKSISKKDPSKYEPWMTALMSADGKRCDWTDKKYLKPLLDYLGI